MKVSWRETQAAMAGNRCPKPGDPAGFWADFRARARRQPQAAPARTPGVALLFPRWAWAGAAAAVLVAVAGIGLIGLRPAADASQIKSVEVVASHGGVVIMEDKTLRCSVLWIVDMKTGEDGGGLL